MKKGFFKNKKEIIFLVSSFCISLIFFIWQKKLLMNSSWDFLVYVMNAEYLFKGFYFEWLRPPLVSWIMALFIPLGRQIAIYSFIIISTFLYFLSLKLFHDKFLKQYVNSEIFYLLAINPFILGFGLSVGTELLSLTWIMFFLTFSFSYPSFIFLGLAILTRHSNALLTFMVFFSNNLKKILLGFLIILLVISPWILLNYLSTGHALTSLGDNYALNVLEQPKTSIEIGKIFLHLLITLNLLIPFLLSGIFKVIKRWKELEDKEKIMIHLLMVLSIIALTTYIISPIKEIRYLLVLSLPAIYFSFFGINSLIEPSKKKKKNNGLKIFLTILLIIISLSTFAIMWKVSRDISSDPIKEIIPKINNNCTISSDLWVYFNWQGMRAIPEPSAAYIEKESQISLMTKEGYNIILLKKSESYQKNRPFINNLNASILEDNDKYIWIYNNQSCKQIKKVDSTYIESKKQIGEFPQEFSPCDALLTKLKLTKICKIFPFL